MYSKDYRKKLDRVIYAFISKDKNIFYINLCNKDSERETYRHNIKGRRYYSKNFIDDMQGVRPCMFILDEIRGTERAALRYKIVWTKIFMQNGYKSYNNEKINKYAQKLDSKNQQLYDERKDVDLNELLSCTNCFVPTYKDIKCEKEK